MQWYRAVAVDLSYLIMYGEKKELKTYTTLAWNTYTRFECDPEYIISERLLGNALNEHINVFIDGLKDYKWKLVVILGRSVSLKPTINRPPSDNYSLNRKYPWH